MSWNRCSKCDVTVARWPQVLRTTQVQRLLRNELGTNFSTITLWAYKVGGPDAPFCATLPIPEAELAAETEQFAELTAALMALPASPGAANSYWLESWENDWATRCGSYSAPHPPGQDVREAYAQWLGALQAGVERGRTLHCEAYGGRLGAGRAVDCRDQAAVTTAAAIKVLATGAACATHLPFIPTASLPLFPVRATLV